MQFNLLSPREQLVRVMNRIYYGGMTTLSGGNLSILDEDGKIWITPGAVDKGQLLPRDIVCIHPDGTVEGLHKPSSELPFHRAIYKARPDIRAIVHAHPPALVTFSIIRKIPDTNIIPQARRVCGRVGYAKYALPGSEALGVSIATSFGESYDVVLLENHGMAAVGTTLQEAFQRLETLDFCARIQMYAKRLGDFSTLTDAQIEMFDHRENILPEFTPHLHTSAERELREKIVEVVHRAYARQLMISTEGVVSARLDDTSFLITPTGQDRQTIDMEDVVLISDGHRETGKLPSRSVMLHNTLYGRHPEINSIMTAQSPYATAYTLTEEQMNTRTIPESFVMLRDIARVPYGTQFNDYDAIADVVSPSQPVVLIQNDCVLTTGTSVLQAFDRLEVAEFTARSLVETRSLGDLIPITEPEVENLIQKFFT
ncbi:MAG: class II aldolase/adducin family protein [Chloroflexota bacterium]